MKFAVYIIVVQDTEEDDMRIGSVGAESVERVAGNMESDDAFVAANAMRIAGLPYDEGNA